MSNRTRTTRIPVINRVMTFEEKYQETVAALRKISEKLWETDFKGSEYLDGYASGVRSCVQIADEVLSDLGEK